MRVLTLDFVKSRIEGDLNPRIADARAMNNKLLLHVEGIGTQEALSRINEYENKLQYEARVKHAISNEFVTEELLRPTDNIFNARGGSKNYKFSVEKQEETYLNILTNVKDGLSLSQYIEQVWFQKYITDPNGLIFMEATEDGEDLFPTYKNIHSIRDYEQNGIHVNWVIFEPHIIIEDENDNKKVTKVFRAADEVYLYEFSIDDKGIREIDKIEHGFNKVPAVLCSNIIDNKTNWKKSPIDKQIGLLNKKLVTNSILSIAEFQHNYPREWTYVDECAKCNGTGNLTQNGQTYSCDKCDGTGKAENKDVTDVIKLRVPREGDAKIDPPSGFTYLPTDSWENMVESDERYFHQIIKSHWGATKEKAENETATGRWIDVQPVNNRLDKYSSSTEIIHQALADFYGEYFFPETFEGAFIQYGRRYLLETPDQIWKKYIDAKEKNAPTSTLDLLLSQYYESEFRDNKQMFIYESKKAKLEPFIHWDIETVRKSETIREEDKIKKEYYNEWILSKPIQIIINTDIKILEKELDAFAQSKNINLNNNQNES